MPQSSTSSTPSSSARVLVLNGPNLNLLGRRQPEIYGTDTLADVEKLCAEAAAAHGLETDFRQSNHEGQLVDWIQEAREHHAAIVINPAAYTHTSVAVRDALAACDELPIMEVHISNIHRREEFRHHSYVSPVADGVIAGCGIQGYALAVQRVAHLLEQREGDGSSRA
ncbi:type II 3-dehydroquinate dehydratase [Streptomyces sp. NPDC093109]|uniref:type II 3-dehydroquinate dehydratase n=1 Tax=Streptomyces sp. NPDC093109 TaxID=3154977 RepID=UPI00344E69E1